MINSRTLNHLKKTPVKKKLLILYSHLNGTQIYHDYHDKSAFHFPLTYNFNP